MKSYAATRVSCGPNSYLWIDHWARIPETESARTGWAHNGIVITEGGHAITYHPGERRVLVLDSEGNLVRSWEADLTEGHGITLVKENGSEYLWIADNATKAVRETGYAFTPSSVIVRGQVVKLDLEGRTVMKLRTPAEEDYGRASYAPTAVAVNEERFGGNGDIWVADGYGLSRVYRFDKRGELLGSIDGTEGAGRFDSPHSVYIDRRKPEAELYVADRENRRIQVYDLEGRFRRSFGSDFLTTPSGFAAHGDLLFVAELRARLAVLDIEDRLLGYLGENEAVCEQAGWPNRRDADNKIAPTDRLQAGKFNSPHGIASDREGNVYVSEWLIGGRVIKLQKV